MILYFLGVMLSHRNLLTSIEVLVQRLDSRPLHDVYIAYLPLAHVLELGGNIKLFFLDFDSNPILSKDLPKYFKSISD